MCLVHCNIMLSLRLMTFSVFCNEFIVHIKEANIQYLKLGWMKWMMSEQLYVLRNFFLAWDNSLWKRRGNKKHNRCLWMCLSSSILGCSKEEFLFFFSLSNECTRGGACSLLWKQKHSENGDKKHNRKTTIKKNEEEANNNRQEIY